MKALTGITWDHVVLLVIRGESSGLARRASWRYWGEPYNLGREKWEYQVTGPLLGGPKGAGRNI